MRHGLINNLFRMIIYGINYLLIYDFSVDISGNNVLIDGILNTNNIIRTDVICSQQGTSFGQFGFC